GHALDVREAGHRWGGDGGLGAPGDHEVGFVVLDEPAGVAQGMGGGRARGHGAVVRALESVAYGDDGRGYVAHEHGDEERGHPGGALLEVDLALLFEGRDAAGAGAYDDPDA